MEIMAREMLGTVGCERRISRGGTGRIQQGTMEDLLWGITSRYI